MATTRPDKLPMTMRMLDVSRLGSRSIYCWSALLHGDVLQAATHLSRGTMITCPVSVPTTCSSGAAERFCKSGASHVRPCIAATAAETCCDIKSSVTGCQLCGRSCSSSVHASAQPTPAKLQLSAKPETAARLLTACCTAGQAWCATLTAGKHDKAATQGDSRQLRLWPLSCLVALQTK